MRSFLLLIVLSTINLYGQSIAYKHFSVVDGLPGTVVYSVCEDKSKKIWVGTSAGLYYLSGSNFRRYDLPEKIKNSVISSIDLANDGSLYFLSKNNGLYKLKNNRVEICIPDTFDFKLGAYIEIHGDKCLLYRESGLPLVYNINLKRFFFNLSDIDLDNSRNKNNLLDSNAIITFSEDTLNFIANDLSFKTNYRFPFQISNIEVEQNNLIHIATKNSVYRFSDYKIIDSISFDRKEGFIPNSLFCDSKGRYWISSDTYDRSMVLLPDGSNIDLNTLLGTKTLMIAGIIEDSKGNVWLSTLNDGLYLIHNILFKTLTFENNKLPLVLNLRKSKENGVFVCTALGLYEYKSEKIEKRIISAYGSLPFVYDIARINEKQYVTVRDEFRLPNDKLEDNTDDKEIINIDGSTMSNPVNNTFYVGANMPSMIKMTSDLSQIKTEGEAIKLPNNYDRYITSMYLDTNSNLWLGTLNGIYEYKSRKFFKHDGVQLNASVNRIIEKNKVLYFCMTSGLNIYKNGNWKSISKIGQISLSSARALAFDSEKNIWVAAREALFCFKRNDTLIYNSSDGILPSQISSLYFDSLENKLLLGSYQGLSILNLNNKAITEHIADVISLEEITIENKKRLESHDSVIDLKLTPYEYNISFRLSSKNILHNNEYKYFYKIDEEVWQNMETNILELKKFERGHHTILFKASYDGIHYSKPITLNISAKPHFWQTIVFKVVSGLFALLLMVLILFIIYKKIKIKNKQKIELVNQMNDLKYGSLMSSINPHFVFNAMNSIQSYINSDELISANDYLVKFSRLMRLILDKANDKYISIQEEAQRMEYYLSIEKMRFGDKLNYKIQVDNSVANKGAMIPNMVIQPFIENAIIHGLEKSFEQGIIEVRFKKENEKIIIEIDDNGIGINQSKPTKDSKHKSMAMNNIKQRFITSDLGQIEIMDKSIFNQKGTLIRIVCNPP
jgi:sensor histidine kinase YesM